MVQTLLNNWYAQPETGHTADNVWACSGSDDEWNPGLWRPIPLAVCGRALSYISVKSGPTATAKCLTIGCRTSSRYLTAVRALLSTACKFRTLIQTNATPHYHGPTTVSVIFKDIAVGTTLSRPPHPYTSVTCGNAEVRLICEERWTTVTQLPILVIQRKLKSVSMVLWQKYGVLK